MFGEFDALKLDKVCPTARIILALFEVFYLTQELNLGYGDMAEWLKAAVC